MIGNASRILSFSLISVTDAFNLAIDIDPFVGSTAVDMNYGGYSIRNKMVAMVIQSRLESIGLRGMAIIFPYFLILLMYTST